jgi:methionine-rich copper-binding protein CopC
MLARITVPLLAAAVLIFTCGPRSQPNAIAARAAASSDSTLVTDVQVTAEPDARAMRFSLSVANGTGKRVELSFPSGQTHDFVVLDATGREVWRWSDGRLFTQLVQNQLLEARDVVTYDVRWPTPPSAGRYTLVAVLRSDNHPVEQRVSFAVQ